MPYELQKPFSQRTIDKAHAFSSEHAYLLGTFANWSIAEIDRLARAIYDQSQHYHESFTEEVLIYLQAYIDNLTQKEQSVFKTRFSILAEKVRASLEARKKMNTSYIKASQDEVFADLVGQEIPEVALSPVSTRVALPFTSKDSNLSDQERVG